LNGDVVFGKPLIEAILKEAGSGLAVEFKACGEEEVKVKLENNRIIEISKQVALADSAGEFIGVALFRKAMREAFWQSLKEQVEQEKNMKDYFEGALDKIADKVNMIAVDITGLPVVEVDFPEDLERAKEMVERL